MYDAVNTPRKTGSRERVAVPIGYIKTASRPRPKMPRLRPGRPTPRPKATLTSGEIGWNSRRDAASNVQTRRYHGVTQIGISIELPLAHLRIVAERKGDRRSGRHFRPSRDRSHHLSGYPATQLERHVQDTGNLPDQEVPPVRNRAATAVISANAFRVRRPSTVNSPCREKPHPHLRVCWNRGLKSTSMPNVRTESKVTILISEAT